MSRIILSIELVILCGPAITLLALGILFLPASLTALFFHPFNSGDWPAVSLITICGTWGVISLANLARYAYKKEGKWPGRPTQWLGILMGLSACGVGMLTSTDHYIILAVLPGPIIATAHLLYLANFCEVTS
ncbi:hypothetical protein D3C78_771160 [compost metagenome]